MALLATGLAGAATAQTAKGSEDLASGAELPDAPFVAATEKNTAESQGSSADALVTREGSTLSPITLSSAASDGRLADAQAATADPESPDTELPDAPQVRLKGYQRPDQKTKLVNYLFDAYGPFPLVGSALVAGINQAEDSVPDWGQGLKGYGRRWGSNFGIGAITTTTRYGMSELLHEDTLYYRCQCTGFFPRLGHALISTFTGRRGDDGHRVFSVPSLVAPYVGEMVAVYAWYPGRYSAKDAFRQGNYSLLTWAGGNVALEFFPSGPRSFLSKMHLQNRRAAPEDAN